jgi:3-hydroxyisobutyrate dehydrogenase
MARIAFLGLGRMGIGMAGRLLERGHELAVYNRSSLRARPLIERGARWCDSPREAATGAEAIFSMVADDVASRAVWLGADGALAGRPAPAALTIECTTLSHAWAVELAAACGSRSLRPIDAPVTGLPDGAANGTLTLLVGAARADLDAARELLDAVSSRIFHFGPVGTGTIYKLLVNLIGAIQIASAAEGLVLAERAGLDPAVVAAALASGQAASPQVVRHTRAMIGSTPEEEVTFTGALRRKDVEYALQLYRGLGMPAAMGTVVAAHYRQLCELGYAESGESRIIEVYRKLYDPVDPA